MAGKLQQTVLFGKVTVDPDEQDDYDLDGLGRDAVDRSDETIAVLRHRFDKARSGRIVAELAAKRADALSEGFVGDRNAAPDLFQKAVLGDQPSLFADQQRQGVKVARIKLNLRTVAAQPAVVGIEHETVEAEAFQNILRGCS